MAYDPFAPGTSAAAHTNADTDSTAEALHHTIGKGRTQAAAGSHTHKYSELSDTEPDAPPPDLTVYVKKAGDNMSGKLQIDTSKGLTLHSPGVSVVSLGSGNAGGGYELEVRGDWDADSGGYAPVRAGYPLDGGHLARVDWVGANYAGVGHGHDYAASGHGHDYAGSGHEHSYAHGSLHGPVTIAGNETGRSFTYPHGLGRTPTACVVQPLDDTGLASVFLSITTWDATNIIFLARNLGAGAETVRFSVIAMGQ